MRILSDMFLKIFKNIIFYKHQKAFREQQEIKTVTFNF